MNTAITAERLRELLDYSIVSGKFYWKIRPCNRVKVGAVAGRISASKYRYINLDGKPYSAHRLVFLWLFGSMPDALVDHLNGAEDCNGFHNLRPATRSQNAMNNTRTSKGNACGLKGVYPHSNGYRTVVGKKCGPVRQTPEQAYVDACRLRTELHGEFANHG